jgi:tetratricopeptide (TPR) repeat protein
MNRSARFLLRLTQTTVVGNQYQIEIALHEGNQRMAVTSHFRFSLRAEEQEDLRWYLEDYLRWPFDPAATKAARVVKWMASKGKELFNALFGSSDAMRLWARMYDQLPDIRVEIVSTEVEAATAIPWELLCDPQTDMPVALRAGAFVRSQLNPAQPPKLPVIGTGPIRILLVICRPAGRDDVPFRSVANQLIKGLGGREDFQIDVLRPPTFEQLNRHLREARDTGQPYHVVHFDGHGVYLDLVSAQKPSSVSEMLRRLSPLVLGLREGSHGYLLFENARLPDNIELVDGPTLGKLLVETEVPILVLNACRSAHAEPADGEEREQKPEEAEELADAHAKVRALGSLAQEVMDAGLPSVVAMRYNVYVVTAAQFVADLYGALTKGLTLGEAATRARKQLAAQPLREVIDRPLELHDWPVPVVYETRPLALFPRLTEPAPLTITVEPGAAMQGRNELEQLLPKQPDVGFLGRDETLLALDRAFDTQHLVLLNGFAGSGKTATAAEFASWYSRTGGVEGPVLFTSFEQHRPLARVLDTFEQVFRASLERNNIHWLTLDASARRQLALKVMQNTDLFWIWDNVEPIAGFPSGTKSDWSSEEQQELADFLRAGQETRAKFLLTSRREEWEWLGNLPRRVALPPMPRQERMQMARALAVRHGERLIDVPAWQPLLDYTQGNPLTITVVVSQALRDGLRTKEQIGDFVRRLRRGEPVIEDEKSEKRDRSLYAALSYGLATFSKDERHQLALLHLFQGFVNVDTLLMMGNPQFEWCVPAVRNLSYEQGYALLERAAEIGLLTAHGEGYYSIHPALPWYFKSLYDEFHSTDATGPVQAFVVAMAEQANRYHDKYEAGDREVIELLDAEEGNLLHARQLARAHSWWRSIVGTMRGLRVLYTHTGQRTAWVHLVTEISPDFVDPATHGPLPEREEWWGLIMDYLMHLAEEARQWEEAEYLQQLRVTVNRQRASKALAPSSDILDDTQRDAIQALASSLVGLGQILRKQKKPECVAAYEEAKLLNERIGDQIGAAINAFNLACAYREIPAVLNLDTAEAYCRTSLSLFAIEDWLRQAQCWNELGLVALARSINAVEGEEPGALLISYLNTAIDAHRKALRFLIPHNEVRETAVTHSHLGNINGLIGRLDEALQHYNEAIRLFEAEDSLYSSAIARLNVALNLDRAGRSAEALLYAEAALQDYRTFGYAAEAEIKETERLIAIFKQHQQANLD